MATTKQCQEIEELLRKGEVAPAVQAIDGLLAADAADADALTFRARLRAFQGDFDAALKDLEQALASAPEHEQATAYRGSLLFEQNRHDEARALLESAVKANPDNAVACFNLARCLARAGELQPARTQLEAALKADPDNAHYHFSFARLLFDVEDYGGCFDALKRSVELNANLIEAWAMMAELQVATDGAEDAVKNLREALKHNPKHPLLRDTLVNALGRAGDMEGAIVEAESLVDELPDNPDLMTNLSTLYMAQQRFSEAEDVLRRAVRMARRNPRAHYQLASLVELAGTPEAVKEARTLLEYTISLDAGFWKAYSDLALIHMNYDAHKDDERALELLLTAYQQEPQEPELSANLAVLYARTGEHDAARQLCEVVAEMSHARPAVKEMCEALLKEL